MYDVCTFGQLFRTEKNKRTQEHCHIQHLHSLISLQTLYWFLNVCQEIPLVGASLLQAADFIVTMSVVSHSFLKLVIADSFMTQVGLCDICLRTVSS